MRAKRKLTAAEKEGVAKWALAHERPRYPNATIITIQVNDDLDEKSHVRYRTIVVTDTMVALGQVLRLRRQIQPPPSPRTGR